MAVGGGKLIADLVKKHALLLASDLIQSASQALELLHIFEWSHFDIHFLIYVLDLCNLRFTLISRLDILGVDQLVWLLLGVEIDELYVAHLPQGIHDLPVGIFMDTQLIEFHFL